MLLVTQDHSWTCVSKPTTSTKANQRKGITINNCRKEFGDDDDKKLNIAESMSLVDPGYSYPSDRIVTGKMRGYGRALMLHREETNRG